MQYYLRNKEDVAQSVLDELAPLKAGSALTMTISLEPSGAYSVHTVTDASSEDIVSLLGRFYLDKLTNTS